MMDRWARSWCVKSYHAFLSKDTNVQVDPAIGNVGFGSGLHGWAFSLKQFAEMYAEKFGVQSHKLMKNLWGDRFYNAKSKKWESSGDGGGEFFLL